MLSSWEDGQTGNASRSLVVFHITGEFSIIVKYKERLASESENLLSYISKACGCSQTI